MSEHAIARPEPQEIDEGISMTLRILSTDAHLKGRATGGERCDNCMYYLEPTADISYCWHEKLRILVGAEWWCQWWDGEGDDA